MHKQELIRYSTGFYGSIAVATDAVISPFQEERVGRIQYDSTIFNRNPKQTIILNRNVSDLHTAYLIDSGLFLRKFDNREKIISAALKTFGNDFSAWYWKHAKDENIDTGLIDFIEDTANFINNGKRKYPLESWKRMIEIKVGANAYREVPENIATLTRITSHNRFNTERRLTTDVVQEWLTQPAGIIDMLQSLNIMFGPIQASHQ